MKQQDIQLTTSISRAFGVVNIGEQYRRIWSDGTTVISFPDGSIVREADGSFIKKGSMGSVDVTLALLQRQLAPIDSYVDRPLYTSSTTTVVQPETEDTPCRLVRFQAGSSNSGTVTIGSTSLDSTNGAVILSQGEAIEISFSNLKNIRLRFSSTSDTLAYSYAQ